jgi:predicted GNAT superfamily acetyltransferase
VAWEWRLATRWAFTELRKAGFVVTDYHRVGHRGAETGAYLLESGNVEDFVSQS